MCVCVQVVKRVSKHCTSHHMISGLEGCANTLSECAELCSDDYMCVPLPVKRYGG